MFSVPFMVKSATTSYGYANDDILNDLISTFVVIATAIGEILGPLFAGFISDWAGIENACTLAGLFYFTICITFVIGTGLLTNCFRKHKKSQLLNNTKVIPEDEEEYEDFR